MISIHPSVHRYLLLYGGTYVVILAPHPRCICRCIRMVRNRRWQLVTTWEDVVAGVPGDRVRALGLRARALLYVSGKLLEFVGHFFFFSLLYNLWD
jgi:hypothetical protein